MRWVEEADDSCVRNGGGGIHLDQEMVRLLLLMTVAMLKVTIIQPCYPRS